MFLTALKSGRSKIKAPNDPVWSEGLPDPCFVDDIFLAVFSHGKRNSETLQSSFCKGIHLIQEGVHRRLTKASFPNPCTSVIRCKPMDLAGDTNVHSTTI